MLFMISATIDFVLINLYNFFTIPVKEFTETEVQRGRIIKGGMRTAFLVYVLK